MPRPVHFLAIGDSAGAALCGHITALARDGEGNDQASERFTVLVQRVTCPICLDRLSRLLANQRNLAALCRRRSR
jgi:hypothetical protein